MPLQLYRRNKLTFACVRHVGRLSRILICLCVISAFSAPLRFILPLDIFTTQAQKTQR